MRPPDELGNDLRKPGERFVLHCISTKTRFAGGNITVCSTVSLYARIEEIEVGF